MGAQAPETKDPSRDSADFYESIVPFDRFTEVVDGRHYRTAPSDWVVVITDVKGSTQAIAENRYKDVNMIGASSIVAVLNSLSGREVPFIFGGDGATILVHESDVPLIKPALMATQIISKETLGLEIRAGLVPVSHLEEAGATVEVAKYKVSNQATLAMVRGGGLAVAEKWIKADEAGQRYQLKEQLQGQQDRASFNGLSCRWNPIKARRGQMLTMLILALGPQEGTSSVYREILNGIEQILGDDSGTHPVTVEKLDARFNSRNLRTEIRIRSRGKSPLGGLGIALRVIGSALFTFGTYKFNLKFSFFNPKKYVSELASSTDFRKFDDMLRMIRDCDEHQTHAIQTFLERKRLQGQVVYGLHASSEALMTCLVFNLSHHVHFIDGSDGGYAIAAKQLKTQMASLSSVVLTG